MKAQQHIFMITMYVSISYIHIKVMRCKESFCLDHVFWVLKFTVDLTRLNYVIFFLYILKTLLY